VRDAARKLRDGMSQDNARAQVFADMELKPGSPPPRDLPDGILADRDPEQHEEITRNGTIMNLVRKRGELVRAYDSEGFELSLTHDPDSPD